jgi:amino acid transporter
MGCVHCLHVIRTFAMLCVIIPRRNAKKLRRRFKLIFNSTVLLFEIIWLIYGNTFHYSAESLACKEIENVKPLWILMMVELIIGYIIYLSCGLIVGGISVFFWYKSFSERRQNQELARDLQLARMQRQQQEEFIVALSLLKKVKYR